MHSMTGFGHLSRSLENVDIAVDLRTVNSRYFDFRPRLSKEIAHLEGELKKVIQSEVKRGRVDLYIELVPRAEDQLELNEALLQNYLALAEEVRRAGVKGELSLQDILNLPGVCVSRKDLLAAESIGEGVVEAISEVVAQVARARRSEGNTLRRDLRRRLAQARAYLEQVAGHASNVSDHYRTKLSSRLQEVLNEHELDESRLAQEVFYYSEKSDISEEITRLQSHFDRFSEYLEGSDGGPVGKTLDFLCQEMNREINTILSKSGVVEISGIAIQVKGEIEKIREQVQNVE